jgi:hypothetical protein
MTEMFWTFLITSAMGLILTIGRQIYRSKCTSISLCMGCIDIERDTITEEKIDEIQLARNRRNAAASTGIIGESEEDFV